MIAFFREHHVDPVAVVDTTFLTTWGDTSTIFLLIMAVPVLMLLTFSPENIQSWYHVILFWAVWTGVSSCGFQTHKWSHTPYSDLPYIARLLQKMHLALSFQHHHVHHRPPHLVRYCTLNGLANYPLDFIDFWTKLEWVVEKLTGLKPREDDLSWSKRRVKLANASTNPLERKTI